MDPNKAFHMIDQGGYEASIFQNTIQVVNSLMCILYGDNYSTILHTSWVPLIMEIISKAAIFNLASILFSYLNQVILKSLRKGDQ